MRLAALLGTALAATALLGWLLGLAVEGLPSGALVDGPVAAELSERQSPQLTKTMKSLTWLGNRGVVLAAMALACAVIWAAVRDMGPVLFLGASVLGGYAASQVVKVLVDRVRPVNGLVHSSGGSFPSGHALASVTLYGGLAIVIWTMSGRAKKGGARQKDRSPALRFAACGGAAILIFAIALSRVYLGVHWTSDVLGGALLGAVWVTACRLAWSGWDRLSE